MTRQEQPTQLLHLEHLPVNEDPWFNAYMNVGTSKFRPAALQDRISHLADIDDPIAQYAAGWTAAELALRRARGRGHPNDEVSLNDRVQALETARQCWRNTGKGLPTLQEAQTKPESKLAISRIHVRSLQALAYIPLMEVAASVLSDSPLSQEEVSIRRQTTSGHIAHLGQVLLSAESRNALQYNLNERLINEIGCAIAGLNVATHRYLVLPASFRATYKP